MDPGSFKKFFKAQAPVNIAVIKYWGKGNEELKIPINDSISGTINMDDMCTTTSIYLSDSYDHDRLFINGDEQNLEKSPAGVMIADLRKMSAGVIGHNENFGLKLLIISENNFPTAAGLASSAAGYACLAFTLSQAFGITDRTLISTIARKGSGSACRSLFGGFVRWLQGSGPNSSIAQPIVDHLYWPSMRVVICVVNDEKKGVSSSSGMSLSVKTSPLLQCRAKTIVPQRVEEMEKAIRERNFETFAKLTMQDSNQFHAICLDTFPPIFYLNETSRLIIKICTIINKFYGRNRVAYTFDAGPNACIYLLDDYVTELIDVINRFFSDSRIEIKGSHINETTGRIDCNLLNKLEANINKKPSAIKYIINTSLGEGPRLLESSS